MGIEYIGLTKGKKGFSVEEIWNIREQSERYYRKICRDFVDAKLLVNIKKKGKAGNRVKYSIHLRIDEPSLKVQATQADWDLNRALHKAFANVLNEVKKRVKKDVTKKKRFFK